MTNPKIKSISILLLAILLAGNYYLLDKNIKLKLKRPIRRKSGTYRGTKYNSKRLLA